MPVMPLRPVADPPLAASLSFAPPERRAGHPLVAVGPGRPASLTPGSVVLASEPDDYDVQTAKVQRPALRDETLERPRLLDWLRVKVHGRVVLLLADAGYGKTTLLADFSRRTRVRTLWYRLDETDRDWTTLLRHLVAAGREHEPGFAPETAALLREIGPRGPGREVVLDAFLRELPTIAEQGTALIFDDFHLVDDAVDVRHIGRELLARGPERLTLVFASRRAPALPLSRLRAAGEVAELDTDALRFDLDETRQLFHETYGRRLEADVVQDLAQRTEGWIASLQLVQAALRDRSPAEIRRFVQTLTGADHEMYDYLAEEVVGDLPEELQRFLMDTSILQVVTPELAAIVSGQDAVSVARLTSAAERLTLLSRISGGPRTHQRYHPLVREFLEGRFRSIDGQGAVADRHRRTAIAVAASDWRVAAHHYREAGDTADMLGTISTAIPTIMGNGQYALAETYIGPIAPEDRPPGFDLILSRVEMQHGDYQAAIAASQAVLDSTSDPVQRDYALLNLLTAHFNSGNGAEAGRLSRLLAGSAIPALSGIGNASAAVIQAAEDGSIEDTTRLLRRLARQQEGSSVHHFGVTMYIVSQASLALDRPADSLVEALEASEALRATSAGLELAATLVGQACVLIQLGRPDDAEALMRQLVESPDFSVEADGYLELAAADDSYGAGTWTRRLLDVSRGGPGSTDAERRMRCLVASRFLARRGRIAEGRDALEAYPTGIGTAFAQAAERKLSAALIEALAGSDRAITLANDAEAHAERQGAIALRRIGSLLVASCGSAAEFSESVSAVGEQAPWSLSYIAELVVRRYDELTSSAARAVEGAATLHPQRWRRVLRSHLDTAEAGVGAARLLELIGEKQDVRRLRAVAKSQRKKPQYSDLGRVLARRVADKVWVEDQGRVTLTTGSRTIPGSTIRRKVLGLLCFLVSRGFSATRDQVLDALWPELDPDVAVNSLNQTVYFLRRVFEEEYVEDLSPGYLRHDSDVIWLDTELVSSRSAQVRALLRTFSDRPSPDDVERLVDLYHGRFALDFEYEEWAAPYRDSMHAAYLEVVERAVRDDLNSGYFDRGISIARKALEVDPSAEQIEVSLLRLYKATGAHAAAAEQYGHYASMLRDELGLEPPPLESL